MITVLLMSYQAVTSRMDGGGLFAPSLAQMGLKFLPCLMYAVPFYFTHEIPILAILAIFVAYFAKNTGHGIVLWWGKEVPAGRMNDLPAITPIVNLIADGFKIPLFQADDYSPSIEYCRLFMAVKGALIGAAAGIIPAIAMAIIQPLAYEIGHRLFKKSPNATAEIIQGACTGLVLGLLIF